MNRTTRALSLTLFATGTATALVRGPLAAMFDDAGLAPRTRAVVDADGVVVAVLGAVRIAAIAACVALALLGLLHLAAASSGARPLHALARALTPHALRPFLGVVTVAALATPAAAATSAPPTIVPVTGTAPPPTMQRTTTPTTAPATATTATAVLDVAVVSPVFPKHRAGAPDPAPTTWTIRRGEHLWHVAAEVTTRALGRAATEDEIAPYWRALIAANRDRLVDPDNPDLVHAGLELVLPPPTSGR